MDIYSSLVTALSAIAALKDGNNARVYPTAAPEGAGLPHLVFQQTKREDILTVSGASGISEVSFRLDLAARTYADIVSLRAAVQTAVNGMNALTGCLNAELTEPDGEGYASGWEVVVRPVTASFIINNS